MPYYNDKPKIIITGAAGFIGSCVVQHLNEQGYENLILVDNLEKGEKWKNLVGKKYEDLIPTDRLWDLIYNFNDLKIEGVIHLGACSSTVETDADYLLENNYRYTRDLATWCLENDVRFIYASSAATYGDGSNGFSDDHDKLESLQPLNMYGYSKHMFDLWAYREGVLDKMVGLKYFNVFGPNEYHKGRMSSAIVHVLPQAQNDGKIKLFKSSEPSRFADGEQKRDFIYVKDAARMTCAFLHNDEGGIFNIGRGEAGSWNQVARGIFKAIEVPETIEYIDMPKDLVGKYQNFTQADMGKTKRALGDAAKCWDLEDAVVDYVKNYLLEEKLW